MKKFCIFLAIVGLSAAVALILAGIVRLPILATDGLHNRPYPTETLVYFIIISTSCLLIFSWFWQLNGELVDGIYYSCGILLIAIVYISSTGERVTLAQINNFLDLEKRHQSLLETSKALDETLLMDEYEFLVFRGNLISSLSEIEGAGFCERSVPSFVDSERMRSLGLARFPPRSLVSRTIWTSLPCENLTSTTAKVSQTTGWEGFLRIWFDVSNQRSIEIAWPLQPKQFPITLAPLSKLVKNDQSIAETLALEISRVKSEAKEVSQVLSVKSRAIELERNYPKVFALAYWPFFAVVLLQMKLCRRKAFLFLRK